MIQLFKLINQQNRSVTLSAMGQWAAGDPTGFCGFSLALPVSGVRVICMHIHV